MPIKSLVYHRTFTVSLPRLVRHRVQSVTAGHEVARQCPPMDGWTALETILR
jgi:hypothetical protein